MQVDIIITDVRMIHMDGITPVSYTHLDILDNYGANVALKSPHTILLPHPIGSAHTPHLAR